MNATTSSHRIILIFISCAIDLLFIYLLFFLFFFFKLIVRSGNVIKNYRAADIFVDWYCQCVVVKCFVWTDRVTCRTKRLSMNEHWTENTMWIIDRCLDAMSMCSFFYTWTFYYRFQWFTHWYILQSTIDVHVEINTYPPHISVGYMLMTISLTHALFSIDDFVHSYTEWLIFAHLIF